MIRDLHKTRTTFAAMSPQTLHAARLALIKEQYALPGTLEESERKAFAPQSLANLGGDDFAAAHQDADEQGEFDRANVPDRFE